MGSPCEIQLFAASEPAAAKIARHAQAEVARLEAKYSRYRDDSLLAEINRHAARADAIEVDAETASLLDYAQACHTHSDGLFDVTSGILRRAWRFDREALPEAATVAALLDRVGWDKLRWQSPILGFTMPGLELDFGGVVKEYAADRAAALCREAGAAGGIVNLGGDTCVIGPRPDGRAWRIGIRHPRVADGLLDTLSLQTGAVASSGDYERCIVIHGTRYGHLLNPRTGWPVRRLAAVTVVGALCVVAGSAATIAMLKEDAGGAWLAALGLPHLWMDVDGRVGGSLAPLRNS